MKQLMKNVSNITILPAFGDNYIYLFQYAQGQCLVVDPGDANSVLEVLESQNLKLTHIFITHHHADHIGGVAALKQKTGCQVIGPDKQRISAIDLLIGNGESIKLDESVIRCISTPGHTATSVCYHVSGRTLEPAVLFTGDTLFAYGCGRMFECDGETMYESLQRLTAFPDDTLVYPGHDYTEENLRFALTLEPSSKQLQDKLTFIQKNRNEGRPTVPSTLQEEKQLNPFLLPKDWETFTKLRRKKDAF